MAKGEHMEESSGGIFLKLICVVILIVLIVLLVKYTKESKETNSYVENTTNIKTENNHQQNNITNVQENIEKEENTQNNLKEENTIIGKEEVIEEEEETQSSSDNEQEAINLVKKEWGEDDSVYYCIDYVSGNIYKISIRSNETTKLWAEYTVDMNNKKVTLDNIY